MKRLLLILFPLILASVIFVAFLLYMNKDSGTGALQVTTTPQSNVYLNGKLIGKSPLCRCEATNMLAVGDYTLRLDPQEGGFAPFEQKITVTKSVLTVVDRTFGKGALSQGSLITLKPIDDAKVAGINILSFPEGAEVLLDNNSVGKTPVYLTNVPESDHEITLKKSGYKDKTIRIRNVLGYKLESVVYLGITDDVMNLVSPTPTASASGTPTPTTKASSSSEKVLILETPNGFLRVRSTASLSGSEIARVTPGDTFDFLDEQDGWYQIQLPDGKTGWVSNQYAEKQK